MTTEQPGQTIHATIRGPVFGQVAIGTDNRLIQSQTSASPPDEDQLASLRRALDELKQEVARVAPPEKKRAALERVDELQEAITASKPDVSTMEYVTGWFVKNIPGLAGAVTSVVVNPIVGSLVAAAGDALAAEFKRRFGGQGV